MNPRILFHIHLWLAVLWTVLVVPTLVYWRDSIAWVAFMSIYAIVVSHAVGIIAAWVEIRAKRRNGESE